MPVLLQIDSCLAKGSTGRITESIGGMMKKYGWDCYIVHGARYVAQSHLESIQVVSTFQEYLHAFGSMLFDRHGLYSRRETKKLIKKIHEIKPDIVHLHCIHGYYINYEILFEYLKDANIPVVWTFHDCWAFTGHCAHFAFSKCEKWESGCSNCPLLNKYPRSFIIDRSKTNWIQKKLSFTSVNNMTVVVVSEWLAALTRKSFFNKYPIQVIHNGVDLSIFRPNENDIRKRFRITDQEILVLGVATSWGKEKGLNEFIELSKERGIQVILVGVSDAIKSRLPKEIIAIGRTESQEELADFYSAADVFVNPTYNDSFPTVNIESLSCGTPVITYRTGGSPEAVSDATGIVIEQGNYHALLKAIRDFKQRSFKIRHTSECRKRAEIYFDKDRCYEEYRVLYNRLLSIK